MKWAGPAFVALLALAVPIGAPSAWIRSGWVPEVALLATLYVAFRGTADRAGWFGIVAGLVAAPWSAEPPLLRATALGTIGLLAGRTAGVVDRERLPVTALVAGLGALLLRAAQEAALGFSGGGGADAGSVALGILVSASATALAAPVVFGLVRAAGLLVPLERTFRDV